MSSKIKNIIILVVIALVLIFVYFYFFGNNANKTPTLVTGTSGGNTQTTSVLGDKTSPSSAEFLTLLLNVKNIQLDNSIFSNKAFMALHDSGIKIIPDNNQGRPNPFAPIGSDIIINSVNTSVNNDVNTNPNTDTNKIDTKNPAPAPAPNQNSNVNADSNSQPASQSSNPSNN